MLKLIKLFPLIVILLLITTNAFAQQKAKDAVNETELALIDNLSSAFENVAKRIKPAVVAVSSVKKAKDPKRQMPKIDPNLEQFFGEEFFNRFFEYQNPGRFSQQGLGSGVIVSKDGYILTNNHVITGADELTITMFDGKKYEAEQVGADPKSDIAVIKIKGDNFQFAELGDSDNLKVGQWVVAAGSPFNLEQTITAGIVSAKGRSNVGIADYEDFIQTDAAINPGNSGGPLVNLRGEIVGINTAIFSKTGGYMGVGFAIPVNMAKNIMNSLIKDGRVTRGFLGVMIQQMNEDLASSFDFDSTEGALVSEITPDSPAERAGIEIGDIIVSFDGHQIKGPSHLRNVVGQTSPKKSVNMKIYRNSRFKVLKIKVGELKAEDSTEVKQAAEPDKNDLGIEVKNITEENRYKLDLPSTDGVVVTMVYPGVAQYNGVRRGDVITSINGNQINSTADFNKELEKTDLKKGLRMSIIRKSGRIFLYIKE